MRTQVTALELRQELANSLTHGFGLIFGIACIPVLISTAASSGNISGIVGASVYGFSFIMLFTFSTLYHSIQQPKVKNVMRKLDHISIYFLIAGTYTPFILTYILNSTGIAVLSILWGLTFVGIFFKIFFTGRFDIISTIIYLAMGWMMVVVAKPFFTSLPTTCIVLVAVGGGLYTLGVVFYLWQRFTFNHAIWHMFVLAASICHYVAVLVAVKG